MATMTNRLQAFRPAMSVQPACRLELMPLWNLLLTVKCQTAETHEEPFRLIHSEEDARVFISTCENPPKPTAEMRSMMQEVQAWFK